MGKSIEWLDGGFVPPHVVGAPLSQRSESLHHASGWSLDMRTMNEVSLLKLMTA